MSGEMYRSKVRVTELEAAEAGRLADVASSTPVIALGSEHAMRGGMAQDAWDRVYQYIDALAELYELGENPGRWGLDLETQQFVSSYIIVEQE